MLDNINTLLEDNEVQVRVGTTWYRLDEIGPITEPNVFPIMVSDDDGECFEFDMADIDEFDPDFSQMDLKHMGVS